MCMYTHVCRRSCLCICREVRGVLWVHSSITLCNGLVWLYPAFFVWVLGLETQALTLSHQALLTTDPSPRHPLLPLSFFLKFLQKENKQEGRKHGCFPKSSLLNSILCSLKASYSSIMCIDHIHPRLSPSNSWCSLPHPPPYFESYFHFLMF